MTDHDTEPIRPTSLDGRAVVFINAYAVDLIYGGREEGGWYYDAGTALGSIVLAASEADDPAIELRAREELRARYAEDYASNRDRHSVIGGPNLEIYRQDHPPADFPTGRQHYE